MKTTQHTTQAELASKYKIHRSTVWRRMEEIGISGEKLGPNRKSPVRYTDEQVGRFEEYIRTIRNGGAN